MNIIEQFGSMQNFYNQFNAFAQQFTNGNNGLDPHQAVINLMNQGRMTQEQFNMYRQIANGITGKQM